MSVLKDLEMALKGGNGGNVRRYEGLLWRLTHPDPVGTGLGLSRPPSLRLRRKEGSCNFELKGYLSGFNPPSNAAGTMPGYPGTIW